MYFANFPSIVYDASGNFDFKVVTNLLRRVALRQKIRENVLIFDTYDVKNGETPEILADKLYGESELGYSFAQQCYRQISSVAKIIYTMVILFGE